jgi:hypothetical protein
MKDMKMEFEDTGKDFMSICFDKVIDDKTMLSATRLLALDVNRNGYINVGEFFQKLSDSDLQAYLNMSESIDDDEASSEVLLVSEMLAIGEGLDNGLNENAPETMQKRMTQLIMYLACESLSRKGLVKLFRENMSFGDDMGNKMIVEKL